MIMWRLRHKSYHSTHRLIGICRGLSNEACLLSATVAYQTPFFFLLTPLIIYMIFCMGVWSFINKHYDTGLKWKFICNPPPPHYMYITSVDVVSFPLKSQLLINSNIFCSVVGDIYWKERYTCLFFIFLFLIFRKWSVAPETIYVYI